MTQQSTGYQRAEDDANPQIPDLFLQQNTRDGKRCVCTWTLSEHDTKERIAPEGSPKLCKLSPGGQTMSLTLRVLHIAVSLAALDGLSEATASVPPSTVGVVVTEQIELSRLIDLCASRLGLLITYDAIALKASKIVVRQPEPLADEPLWLVTNRLLGDQGFALVRGSDGRSLSVVKATAAAQVALAEFVDVDGTAAGSLFRSSDGKIVPGFRKVVVRLQRISARHAAAATQSVLSKPTGTATEFESGNAIVIADYTPYVDAALRLLSQLEADSRSTIMREVPARNVDVARLVTLTKQLAERRKSGDGRELRGDVLTAANGSSILIIAPDGSIDEWEALIALADQREPVERRSYRPTAFGSREVATLIEQTVRPGSLGGTPTDDRWRIVQDDLTGSLIITATIVQHEQVRELLDQLNAVPPESRRHVRSFKIRHRDVRDLQAVLEQMLHLGVLQASVSDEREGAASDSALGLVPHGTPTSSAPAVAPQTSPISGAPQTTILPRPQDGAARPTRGPHNATFQRNGTSANELTLTTDDATSTLIAVGDPRMLAEIERLVPTLDVRQPQVMLEAILVSLSDSQALSFGVELEKLRISGDTLIRLSSLFGLSSSSGSGSAQNRTVGDGTGFTGAVLNPGDFSLVVRALETINNGRSLSQPKILVNNNEQATFNSVLQQPFASTFTPVSSGATTSFGGTQDAGTTITVKPKIAEGDHLALTYSISLSSFVGSSPSPNLPPPRQQNSVQSVATIPDGYTVVVGGLELATNGQGVNQVPFLGSIPILGELFKNRSASVSTQRFFVFIRANVLRQSGLDDLKYMSDVYQVESGVDPSWPELKPRVIR